VDGGDQRVVARLFQEVHGKLIDRLVERGSELAQTLGHRRLRIEPSPGCRRGCQFLHIEAGAWIEHRAARRERDHSHRVGQTLREVGGTFDRIDRDVELGLARRVSDPLAAIELGRAVLGALADHHDAVDAELT
jgi:hypothetical protein